MARPIQIDNGSSSSTNSTSTRMQSAPINISYDAPQDQSFWRAQQYWEMSRRGQVSDDDDSDYEQNYHPDDDEDIFMMSNEGFSGGLDENAPTTSDQVQTTSTSPVAAAVSKTPENDVVTAAAAPAVAAPATAQQTNYEITKAAEMSIDLFEQLLAENELQLRQMFRHVYNVPLVFH